MKPVLGLACSALLAWQLPEPPTLLRDVLRRETNLAILNPDQHLHGDCTIEQLREFGYWPPWLVADFDGDGRSDVAATVVLRDGERVLFAVLAVHAREPKRVHWVDRPASDPIYGVTSKPSKNSVMPLHCIECDANAWYRWSGRSYAVELYAPREQVAIATYEEHVTLGVFERPSRGSKKIAEVVPCTTATVVRVRGEEYRTRWYLVELSKPAGVRGWIPASFAAESECIG